MCGYPFMLLTEYLKQHPMKAWRLKVAAAGRCENCSNEFPQVILEIHVIGSSPDTESAGSDLGETSPAPLPGMSAFVPFRAGGGVAAAGTRSSQIAEGQEDDEGDTWLPATAVCASR